MAKKISKGGTEHPVEGALPGVKKKRLTPVPSFK